MASQPIRRSARILALSTAANKQAGPSSRPTGSSKPSTSTSTRRLKRKAPPAEPSTSAGKDLSHASKRRRIDASAYIVRSEPDPQYLDPVPVAQAREYYLTSVSNPLQCLPIWGENPYREIWKEYRVPDPKIHTLPPMEPVDPLKQLDDVRYKELTCMEVIRDGDEEGVDFTSIFRVRYKRKGYILKLFHSSTYPSPLVESGPHKFDREKCAYERLLHHGVCSQGFVPMCHGWFELRVPKGSTWLHSFASDEKPPNALLLEDIFDGVTLSVLNISPSIAGQALLAADQMHEAGVLHRDLQPRNTLVRSDGTVVIIDFDKASTWPHKGVNLLSLKKEMQLCWCLYFSCMLTDQLMDLTPEQVRY